MVRNRKKKALYEVIDTAKLKSIHNKVLEQPLRSESGTSVQEAEDSVTPASGEMLKWPKKPKMVQFNAGRVEISMPYQLAIALILGIVLLILVFFQLGQNAYKQKMADLKEKIATNKPQVTKWTPKSPDIMKEKSKNVKKERLLGKSTGSNRIVIATSQRKKDLEPVEIFFANNNVETEIRNIGSWYYLVTREKYENPETPGTDGYLAKQEIVELGVDYKAPSGYGSFGARPFSDAYGMKFDD